MDFSGSSASTGTAKTPTRIQRQNDLKSFTRQRFAASPMHINPSLFPRREPRSQLRQWETLYLRRLLGNYRHIPTLAPGSFSFIVGKPAVSRWDYGRWLTTAAWTATCTAVRDRATPSSLRGPLQLPSRRRFAGAVRQHFGVRRLRALSA